MTTATEDAVTGLSYDERILLATAAHFTLNENQLGRFMTADEEATLRGLAERLLESTATADATDPPIDFDRGVAVLRAARDADEGDPTEENEEPKWYEWPTEESK